MKDFEKTIRLGTVEGYTRRGVKTDVSVYCEIKFREGCLSITGVEGPLSNGDAIGSCGQIVMSLEPCAFTSFAPGWDEALVAEFLEVWDRWHLNDMVAGSPAQEAFLRDNPIEAVYPESHYTKACEALKAAGLQPDPGYHIQVTRKVNDIEVPTMEPYSYGSRWLHVDVPESVLNFLISLPDTDKTPAWV